MTRCCKDNINLKSSAYNQTGQSYVEQLALHRSMCTHLRRVLLAKSVVDSRNPKYIQGMQSRYRPSSSKPRSLEGCPSDETIDKLAYDSEHHPSEIIKINCHRKDSAKPGEYIKNPNCSCLQLNITQPKCKHNKKLDECATCKEQCVKDIATKAWKCSDSKYESFSRLSSRERNPESAYVRSSSTGEDSPSPRIEHSKRTSDGEDRWEDKSFAKYVERGEEEARYAKFVYDITQEIVRNGLYTDRELKTVFERHLERSSGHLNKRKMLYEIYQLKISLNMTDGSEDEDDSDGDYLLAQNFSKFQVPKPPTPPKILNDNKILEKLESFKEQQKQNNDIDQKRLSGKKSVVLVDANPEFLVTQRDILFTLMENHVKPEQIQRIYQHLFQKSKDMSLYEAVQVGKEVAYTHRLNLVDKDVSAMSLNDPYTKDKLQGILRHRESNDSDKKFLSMQTSYHKCDYKIHPKEHVTRSKKTIDSVPKGSKDTDERDRPTSTRKTPSQETLHPDKKSNNIKSNRIGELANLAMHTLEAKEMIGSLGNIQHMANKDNDDSEIEDENSDFEEVHSDENEEYIEEEIESEEEVEAVAKTKKEEAKKEEAEKEEVEVDEKEVKELKEVKEVKGVKEEEEEVEEEEVEEEEEMEETEEEEEEEEEEEAILGKKLTIPPMTKEHEISEQEAHDGRDSLISITSKLSQESIKLSDDISIHSESSARLGSVHSDIHKVPSTLSKNKVLRKRYSSIQGYVGNFGLAKKMTSKISSHSSSSSSSNSSSISNLSNLSEYVYPKSDLMETNLDRVITKRTSWGLRGLQFSPPWTTRSSEIPNAQAETIFKYYDAKYQSPEHNNVPEETSNNASDPKDPQKPSNKKKGEAESSSCSSESL